MISTLKNKPVIFFVFAALCALAFPGVGSAQISQSLSVTPPLVQLSAVPGEPWQSAIKIINPNEYQLTVYANPVNFAPIGEQGQGRFIPILEEETAGQTLAEWVSITDAPIVIEPEQSVEIPYVVSTPLDAAPGGHFAAILIGTQPPENDGNTAVRTSQAVSALLFIRVEGDVIEKGTIREFSVAKSFLERPEAEFILRFENKGNVHIRPQGEIKIFNMWGKERGKIPINHESHFGNVLPSSVRKFDFTWSSEPSLSDVGRYTAEVTLAYGSDARQSVTRSVAFYVIPVKFTLISLVILFVLVYLIRWAIKSYVRHMLRMAGIDPEERQRERAAGSVVMIKRISHKDPEVEVDEGVEASTFTAVIAFVSAYRYFFVGIPSSMILLGFFFWYLSGALTSERSFEATITHGDSEVSVNSEQLRLDELSEQKAEGEEAVPTQSFELHVVNVSGEPGVAAAAAVVLEAAGYSIASVEPELGEKRKRTVIVADTELSDDAEVLSELFADALISLNPVENEVEGSPTITIFVGQDAN